MRLSKKGRYGVRAMVRLALQGKDSPVSTKCIAAQENIPMPFLEQLLFRLRKAGLVRSVRGAKGGFLLTERPERISMLDIIRALGETTHPVECVAEDRAHARCRREDRCAPRRLWQRLGDRVKDVLEKTMLSELCGEAKALRKGRHEPSARRERG